MNDTDRIISKQLRFVIAVSCFCLFAFGCSASGGNTSSSAEASQFTVPVQAGDLESKDIDESSGLAVSQCQENVLWTHNDSGGGPYLYAIDGTGRHLGTWRVEGAKNIDWEDLAMQKTPADECVIFIGDFGNNDGVSRKPVVYRVVEPMIDGNSSRSTKKDPLTTARTEALAFEYPDGYHDAEALLVHPATGDIYVVTKTLSDPATVYKLRPKFGSTSVQTAEKIASVKLPSVPQGSVTGGDISADGKRLVLVDYGAAYEFTLPPLSLNFDEIWNREPIRFEIGKREQGETVAYAGDGEAIVATSEGKHSPLWVVGRIRK